MSSSKSRIQEWASPEKIFTNFSAVLRSSMPPPPGSTKELGLVLPFLKSWWSFIKERSGPRARWEGGRLFLSRFLFLKRGQYQASSPLAEKLPRRIGFARFTRRRSMRKQESSKKPLYFLRNSQWNERADPRSSSLKTTPTCSTS